MMTTLKDLFKDYLVNYTSTSKDSHNIESHNIEELPMDKYKRLLSFVETKSQNTTPQETSFTHWTYSEPSNQAQQQSHSTKTPSMKRDVNAKRAMTYLIDKHKMPISMAAGIVGNLYWEDLDNPSRTISDSRGTTSFGIAGFNSKGKLPDLTSWAKQKGLDINKAETQLDYIVDFIKSGKSQDLTKSLNNKTLTPEQASYAFGRYFEVFAGQDGKGYLNENDPEHQRRREKALELYKIFNS